MMGLRSSLCRLSAVLALAALSLALPALAGDDPAAAAPPEQAAAQAPAQAPVAAAGLVAFIDPATGGLTSTPTEEQRAALRAALAALVNESDAGLYEVVLPDGTVVMDLQGRFQEAVVVQVAPDGTRNLACVGSVATAAQSPAAVPQAPAAVAE